MNGIIKLVLVGVCGVGLFAGCETAPPGSVSYQQDPRSDGAKIMDGLVESPFKAARYILNGEPAQQTIIIYNVPPTNSP